MKYYFSDLGLAEAFLGFRQDEISHALENVVYNEMRRRGFEVDVGNLAVMKTNKTGSQTKGKREQESRPFLKIKDVYRKIIITYTTQLPYYTEDGIFVMSIFDFLRQQDSLETLL